MTTQSDHPVSFVDLDPEELLIGPTFDIEPDTLVAIEDDPGDSTLGEHAFELAGARATEAGPGPGQPVTIEEEMVTRRYVRKPESHA